MPVPYLCDGRCGRFIKEGERVIYFGQGKMTAMGMVERFEQKVWHEGCFGGRVEEEGRHPTPTRIPGAGFDPPGEKEN